MTEPTHTDGHPEELLTSALAGNLDEAEWRELRTHLSICRPCSTQLRVAGWLQQDLTCDLAHAHVRDRAAVLRALESWEQTLRKRRAPTVLRRTTAAAIALALSGAAAAMVGSWRARLQARPVPQSAAIQAPAAQLIAPAPALSEASSAPPTPSTEPAPEAGLAKRLASKPAQQPAASVLFARASELRLQGHKAAAIATFERLQKLYPSSRESQTSHLVVGRVWLESQRPDLAAPEFARYLKSGSAANEEALVGHATALRRMGKLAEEATDWQRLLAKFPHSLYAAGATRRLAELQRGGPATAAPASAQR